MVVMNARARCLGVPSQPLLEFMCPFRKVFEVNTSCGVKRFVTVDDWVFQA